MDARGPKGGPLQQHGGYVVTNNFVNLDRAYLHVIFTGVWRKAENHGAPSQLIENSTSSLDINDAIFCEHGKEFNQIDRDPLELPAYTVNAKDGSIQCKKHSTTNCTSCFHKKGVKKSKSKKDSGSNLFV
ncbi:hypothetical protein QFC21_001118 [Naganishia friedmannii]|uniref:Uncharacterized protein n=1 Tax=Naganishia friedmannii TaxID=89922 RepID=A0ACC2W8A7_9TREE|nr:hypothetical protein QFC21_001118 [Naganishia friedmannii]